MDELAKSIFLDMLENHKEWIESDFEEGHQAIFADYDLRGLDFKSLDFRYARFDGSDARGVNFGNAELEETDFSCADLRGADFTGACLCSSGFASADLRSANFTGANLRGVSLEGADLRYARLLNADLRGAFLKNADLRTVMGHGALFTGAQLQGADLPPDIDSIIPLVCPSEGSFVAWKKVRIIDKLSSTASPGIAKLIIPADAKRSSATTRKCRASKAIVTDIYSLGGFDVSVDQCDFAVVSMYDVSFVYEKGKTVEVEDFDPDRWNECSTGIHFFITRAEAEAY